MNAGVGFLVLGDGNVAGAVAGAKTTVTKGNRQGISGGTDFHVSFLVFLLQ